MQAFFSTGDPWAFVLWLSIVASATGLLGLLARTPLRLARFLVAGPIAFSVSVIGLVLSLTSAAPFVVRFLAPASGGWLSPLFRLSEFASSREAALFVAGLFILWAYFQSLPQREGMQRYLAALGFQVVALVLVLDVVQAFIGAFGSLSKHLSLLSGVAILVAALACLWTGNQLGSQLHRMEMDLGFPRFGTLFILLTSLLEPAILVASGILFFVFQAAERLAPRVWTALKRDDGFEPRFVLALTLLGSFSVPLILIKLLLLHFFTPAQKSAFDLWTLALSIVLLSIHRLRVPWAMVLVVGGGALALVLIAIPVAQGWIWPAYLELLARITEKAELSPGALGIPPSSLLVFPLLFQLGVVWLSLSRSPSQARGRRLLQILILSLWPHAYVAFLGPLSRQPRGHAIAGILGAVAVGATMLLVHFVDRRSLHRHS